ncbi:MAG TPA: enoyl-CoA hydratase-related protein [Acidimicrobiales bacterium]|nr:enoyl-CoA hydratase-related protein [Acidimicrobiales bacterium]
MADDQPPVRVRREGPVAVVLIDRPARRNALRPQDVAALVAALDTLDRDAGVRAVLLGGSGGTLCAGGDLADDVASGPAAAVRYLSEFHRLLRSLVDMIAPVVVVLEGAAVGAGSSLALAADVCIAAPDSRIALPFVHRGLVADSGVGLLLARQLGLARAKALLLGGRAVGAEQAEALGLVAAVDADPWAAGRRWADELAAGPPVAIASIKRLLNQAVLGDLGPYLAQELAAASASMGTGEPDEGITAFLEKRPPDFNGAAARSGGDTRG